MSRFLHLVLWAGACAATVPCQEQAQAQGQPVAPASLRALIETIEDPALREDLTGHLRTLLRVAEEQDAAPEPPTVLDRLTGFAGGVGTRLADSATHLIEQLARLPGWLDGVGARLGDPATRGPLLLDAGGVAGVVLAAWLAALLLAWSARRQRARLSEARPGRPRLHALQRSWRLALRLLLDLLPAALAVTVGFAGVTLLPLTAPASAVAFVVVAAIALQRVARAVIGAVIVHDAPELRLTALGDARARRLASSLLRASAVAVYGFFAFPALRALGASPVLLDPLESLYATTLLVLAVAITLRYRRPEAGSGSASPAEPPAAREHQPAAEGEQEDDAIAEASRRAWRTLVTVVARVWWIFALLYSVGLYLLWLSGIEDGFGRAMRSTAWTALYAGIGALGAMALRNLLARAKAALMTWTSPFPAVQRNVPRYVALFRIALDLVLALVVLGFVLAAWGLGDVALLDSEVMRELIATALGVALILLLALVASDLSTSLTQAYLEDRQREATDSAKIRTLVPLANKVIRVVVGVLAILMVLSQVGVAIGPILAGVGFLGVALGFGAQTLVKDLIAGVFNLLEDNVSVGDIVNVGSASGVVEAINIRTIQMRDLTGNKHTVPWGEVTTLSNLTREFGRYLIECGVAYGEDVDEVMDVLRELGAEMQADPEWGDMLEKPIEILGVDRFADSAVIIRARLQTVPGAQWSTGREFNRRMKKTFDAKGIQFPFPHRTVFFGQEKDGTAAPLRVLQQSASGSEQA